MFRWNKEGNERYSVQGTVTGYIIVHCKETEAHRDSGMQRV